MRQEFKIMSVLHELSLDATIYASIIWCASNIFTNALRVVRLSRISHTHMRIRRDQDNKFRSEKYDCYYACITLRNSRPWKFSELLIDYMQMNKVVVRFSPVVDLLSSFIYQRFSQTKSAN